MAIEPILQSSPLGPQCLHRCRDGKRVIAGVFNNVVLPEIPGYLPNAPCVYVALTEVRGEIDVMLHYVDLESGEALIEHGPTKLSSE